MGKIVSVSDTFDRPPNTTTYGANDLVSNSATAASVTPLKFGVGRGGFKIHAIHMTKSDETDVANADFDLNLWTSPVTSTAGDNEAWSVAASEPTGYLGEYDLPVMIAHSTEAATHLFAGETGMSASGIPGHTSTGYIYGLIQADGAYSPASAETFTVTLVVEKI